MSKTLFENSDSESENENVNELKTNKEYAEVYNKFRQKELLKKLKDRGLEESDSEESSSESSISDEDVYDPKFDEEFYKTLSSLKSKDPSIYDKNSKFFENFAGIKKDKEQSENEKALTLKDYERKVILEKGGVYEDDEDDDENENKTIKRPMSPSYTEDQEQLKKEFKQILNDDDEANEEFGGLFKKRNKTKEEKEKEQKDFVQWLAGEQQDIDENKKKKLNPLKQYWNDPNLSKEEKFLRDYVLNNGYTNKSDGIPTYEEIIGDENLSDDEKELEKQADFEHKYNFRFEEPDNEFIKRYPRTIENSVRKTDDRRKLKRLEVKERKQKEKEQKYQELEVLKALKKKEIEEKIQKLKEVTGNDKLPFDDDDLEGDFDPEAHDKRMKEIFNDEYYQVEEDEEKPECPDIEELKIEDWDDFDPTHDADNNDNHDGDDEYEPHCEDDDFIMDCDYEQNCKEKLQNELIENTKDKRKRRRGRRNNFMEIIKKEKPVFNPEDEKTYAEYIDEYYKIDCEDIIGDTPCRFKYIETVPNDFGLTVEEILLAKNKELNQWASLKKAVQIRPEHVERNEAKLYKIKAQNLKLKKKIFRSLYGSSSEDEEEKEKGKKEEITESKNTEVNVKNATNKSEADSEKKEKHEINGVDSEIGQNDKSNAEEIVNKTVHDQSQQKKKKQKNKDKNKVSNNDIRVNNVELLASKANKKRKKSFDNIKSGAQNDKKRKFSPKSNPNMTLSEERLRAYGLNPRKFYKKQRFMNQKPRHNKS